MLLPLLPLRLLLALSWHGWQPWSYGESVGSKQLLPARWERVLRQLPFSGCFFLTRLLVLLALLWKQWAWRMPTYWLTQLAPWLSSCWPAFGWRWGLPSWFCLAPFKACHRNIMKSPTLLVGRNTNRPWKSRCRWFRRLYSSCLLLKLLTGSKCSRR